MILTDITLTKKGRCALFVDGEFLFSAHPDVFYGSGWQKGREVTVEELEQLRMASEERTAKDKALDLLSYSARTGRQLYEKLSRKCDPEASAAAVARMEELGLVDDGDYARRFVADKLNLKDWGLRRIEQELRQKGVAQHHIDAALEELDYDGAARLAEILHRRGKPIPTEQKERTALVNRWLRQGYDYEEIRAALAQFSEE
jgi:regulatory protein